MRAKSGCCMSDSPSNRWPDLRLAEPRDFDAIAAITNHWIRTTAIHFGTEDVKAEELCTSFREHETTYAWVVAEDAGEVIAYAKAGTWRARAAYHYTPETGVYVRHDRLGEGLGRLVYERLVAVCRAQGFRSLMAGAAMPNPASERLHLELGFEPCGRVKQAGWKHGQWWDVAFYQLRLCTDDAPARAIRSPREVWPEVASR